MSTLADVCRVIEKVGSALHFTTLLKSSGFETVISKLEPIVLKAMEDELNALIQKLEQKVN